MKRAAVVAVLLVAAAAFACRSTDPGIARPEIAIGVLPTSSFILERGGRLSIDFLIEVKNRSGERLILERVAMQTMGGTPYVLRNVPVEIDEAVPPNASETFRFPMWAYSRGGPAAPFEPVNLRGTAYFRLEDGRRFAQNFTELVRQPVND